jgi:predicted enzyme related to lactoylglutathione lyase
MNPITWIEIPVNDMKRAITFYNATFKWNLKIDLPGLPEMAFLPLEENAPGCNGTLIRHPEFYKPSEDGALVYFGVDNIIAYEKRCTKNGGTVLIPKKQISPDHGYMAVLCDTEGNRIALHSNP